MTEVEIPGVGFSANGVTDASTLRRAIYERCLDVAFHLYCERLVDNPEESLTLTARITEVCRQFAKVAY